MSHANQARPSVSASSPEQAGPGTRERGADQAFPAHRAVNLASILTQTARRLPDADALVHGGTRWTWRDLEERVDALAAEMHRRGVRPGQCVLLDGPNHPEFVQAMFATWRLGAVLAPVNSRLHEEEIASIAGVCAPGLMIAHNSVASHVTAVESSVDGQLNVLWLDSTGSSAVASCPRVADWPDCGLWVGDAAWYFFTSGTSGKPKAAVLSHDQLGYVITNHIADLMPTTTGTDRSLVVAPLSHGAGIHLLAQVSRGAASVIPTSASLDPTEAWRLVETERVTNVFTVPTILKRLVEHEAVRTRDHSALQYVVYAGAPMAGADQRRAREELGEVLVQYYGLAEVTGNITVLPPQHHDHVSPPGIEFGTCGFPRTGMQVSIQDERCADLPPCSTGEVCVAGPGVFPGYLDNPEANAAAFRDGWFRTGDVGMLDESGFLYITGRLSDMYISGGSNVHPRDIEEKLVNHPDIHEAVVLGMPDSTWGEVGVGVCVAREGSAPTEEEVRGWLAERMTRYKVPGHLVFWSELPRSGYGKIVRRTIRELLVASGWSSQHNARSGRARTDGEAS